MNNVTKLKSNTVIQTTINESIGEIEYNVIGAGIATFHWDRASETNQRRFGFHGAKQRISDAAALSRNPETGLPASPADKLAAVQEMIAHYESGTTEWRLKSSTRATGSGNAMLIQALLELGAKDADGNVMDGAGVAAYVRAKTPAERTALMGNAKIKPIIEKLEAALAADVDGDALLSDLGI